MDKKNIERPKVFDKKEYKKEYAKSHYKRILAEIKPDDYSLIDDYCKKNNISKAKFIVDACKYYIDSHSE
ncbi:MAG: hypothetical protein K2K34_09360 [Oscillospiraceae bacterium]|nr:hypothetical protein [Oscillospiraceae bacterium]